MIIGLTGGIASGKSTISMHLREWEIPVIDADAIAHQIAQPSGSAYQDIVDYFGEEILDGDGLIHRKKLGSIVFSNPDKLAVLNQMTHPRVAEAFSQKIEVYKKKATLHVVYEVPLLFESGLHRKLDHVILVAVPLEIQIQRLIARDSFTRIEAFKRIENQMSLDEKLPLADFVIDNSQSLSYSLRQLEKIWTEITGHLPSI